MTKQAIIQRTVEAINRLPEERAVEISDFADFISVQYEKQMMDEGIQKLTINSKSFDFLNDEEDLYEASDLEGSYNG